jgi:hypothetical protein
MQNQAGRSWLGVRFIVTHLLCEETVMRNRAGSKRGGDSRRGWLKGVAALSCLTLSAIVASFVSSSPSVAESGATDAAAKTETALPPLPDKISSFGAAVLGDDLYVYGGHIGAAHSHSKDNLSLKFSRLNLKSASGWESLPMGPGLQSPALVAHKNVLYRVGGLSCRNAAGEPDELVSLADVERFDPQTNQWTPVTPLPEPRSSHDAVVVGDLLYVVGGWNLGNDQKWHDTALVADLSQPTLVWKKLPPQPFKRRALGVAHHAGRVYAIGGMSETGPSVDVHYFDTAAQTWSAGPAVPGMSGAPGDHAAVMNGFGCSAFEVGDRLLLSTMDGAVHALSADGKSWATVGKLQSPRFFHRMLPHGRELLFLGGAARGGHLDSIERLAQGDLR